MSLSYDYDIVKMLCSSARSLVLRATARQDGTALIIKVLNKDFPSFHEIAQFKREYAIARRCEHPGVARPLELRQDAGRWTIITEDIGAHSLGQLLSERQLNHQLNDQLNDQEAALQPVIGLAEFFDMALQLCEVLALIHHHGIIHKDINPANLIWNSERRRLQLIDFGIASELGNETLGIAHPAMLEGTLGYMAPEQTGRMNRIVDYRADYYAAGVTFYELLTGVLPFRATDPMELMHCHIARAPDWSLPVLAHLPGPLLALLQRLLEKNAEQRYQSVEDLQADLEMCRMLARQPALAQSTLARLSGQSGKLLVPQKLYGRERETEALLNAFGRTCAGPAEILLVTGYSGIGKSALVSEVHKPIVARRGCFISGKFDQYRRDIPYASLIQAFQELVRQLLCEPQEQVRQWSDKLHDALGVHLGVIVGLIPGLELIVSITAPVVALAPLESENRLHRLFQKFIQVFSSADQPLVMFLDDLQWADAPTLRMIALFMRDPEHRYLLVIGAYRDNEVNDTHPLMTLSTQLQRSGVRLTTLALTALSQSHVAQLTADTLRIPVTGCASLSELCHQKTHGNPFFLNQFLAAIYESRHLYYDYPQQGWRWNMELLEEAGYSDNVIDLMLLKIFRVPLETQQLLQLASCVGNRFELMTLAAASEKSAYRTQQDLWPALQAGLIVPLSQDYKYLDEEDATPQVGYRFLHDRVQQASYALGKETDYQHSHLKIGRLMASQATPEELEQQLFTIAEQLNAGRLWMSDPAERLQLARLNQRAASKARSSAAYQAALRHARIGIELLPEDAWKNQAGLCLDLQLDAAEAAYLSGEFAVAEAIYPLVLAQCTTALQKIRCLTIQARHYQLQGHLQSAITILCDGLGLLQIDISRDASVQQDSIPIIAADIERLIAGRSAGEIMAASEMLDPVAVAAMQIMQGLWFASYYSGQQNLSLLMVLSMTRLSLQKGNCDFTSVAYVAYAFYLDFQQDDERSYRFGAMALELAGQRTNLQTRSLTSLMFGALVNHWTCPLRRSDELYDDAFTWALDSGDFVHVGVVVAVRATDRIILGHYLPDLLESVERDISLMQTNGQIDLVDCAIAGSVQPIKCLMGLTRSADSYDDEGFSEAQFLARYGSSRLYHAYFLQGKIRNAFFFDSVDAEALASQLDIVSQTLRGQAKVPECSFYAALIWLRALQRDPHRDDAAEVLARIEALQEKLAAWALKGPANYAAKDLLVKAEMAHYRQDMPLAVQCYRQAIDTARDTGYVNIQALSKELYGQFWLTQGQASVSEVFLREAITHYRQWGADGKARQLELLHANLSGVKPGHTDSLSDQQTSSGNARISTRSANAALDFASIVKASHALSDEIGLSNVLQRLIAIVCENSGAQVARLLLLNDGAWRLEADLAGDIVSVLQAQAFDPDALSHPLFPLSLLRYVVRSGAEVIEDNITVSPRFGRDPYVQMHRPRSVMCLPIRQGGTVAGMLYLENNLADGSFTWARAEFLRILGAQAIISISHARLHDNLEQRVAERTAELEKANRKLATLSATDGLTGLANRRHFDEMLSHEWARTMRTRQPLVIIMIDVDYFKKYNDCYGHQAGDECLKSIARVLQEGTRRVSDLAARYGGEEFTVVLPNTDASVALQLGETIRRSIEALAMTHELVPAGKVTISVGIAVALLSQDSGGGTDSGAAALLHAADEALYRAKRSGRNCVDLIQLDISVLC